MRDLWAFDGVNWQYLNYGERDPYVAGGRSGSYVLPMGQFSPSGGPSARWDSRIVYDPSTRSILLFGGFGATGTSATACLNDIWRWSPSTQQWSWLAGTSSGGGISARAAHGMVVDKLGRLVIMGGYTNNGLLLNDVVFYQTVVITTTTTSTSTTTTSSITSTTATTSSTATTRRISTVTPTSTTSTTSTITTTTRTAAMILSNTVSQHATTRDSLIIDALQPTTTMPDPSSSPSNLETQWNQESATSTATHLQSPIIIVPKDVSSSVSETEPSSSASVTEDSMLSASSTSTLPSPPITKPFSGELNTTWWGWIVTTVGLLTSLLLLNAVVLLYRRSRSKPNVGRLDSEAMGSQGSLISTKTQ